MNIKPKSKICQQLVKKLSQYLKVEEITIYQAAYQQQEVESIKIYKSENRLKASEAQLHALILEQVESSKKDIDKNSYEMMLQFLEEIQPIYQIGDQMQEIKQIEQIKFENDDQNQIIQNTTLQVERGFVYIINLWDKVVIENEGPLDEVLKLYQMNTEWKNKVKIITIALTSSSDEIKDIVIKKKWQCMDHYWILKEKQQTHQFLNMLNYEQLPYALIIGKKGQIVHIGFHFEVDLELLIAQEIQKQDEVTQGNHQNENAESQLYQKIINEIQEEGQIDGQNASLIQQNLDQQNTNAFPENKIQLNVNKVQEEVNQTNENIKKEGQLDNAQKMIKEQIKIQKQQLQHLQFVLKTLQFDGKVKINLIKNRSLKQDGNFIIEAISQFELSYTISPQDLEKLNYFIEQDWEEIPEPLRLIKKARVKESKNILNEIQERFEGIFSNYATIAYPEITNTSITWNKDLEKMVISNNKSFTVQSEGLNLERFYQGIQKAQPYIKLLNLDQGSSIIVKKIIDDLGSTVTLGPGQNFAPILNYKKFGSEQKEQIQHQLGQVLVIIYWKCFEDCISQLKNIEKLIINNSESWGKNVMFVALNFGDEKEYQQFMQQNKELFSNINIYYKKQIYLGDTYLYRVNKFPYFIFVDKFGIIRQVDTPLNIENTITKLVKENKKVKNSDVLKITLQSVNLIKETIVQNNIKEKLLMLDKDKVIEFKLDFEVQEVGQNAGIQKALLTYFIRDNQEEEFNKLLSQLFQLIPENKWIINSCVQQTISIKYPGNTCAVCLKNILTEPKQYYSYFKTEYVCVDCAEFTDNSKKGMDIYKYQDTLIFINGPLEDQSVLQNIDKHKIGKNKKLLNGEEGSQKHNFRCDSCQDEPEGHRYIAVNAKPGQYRKEGYVDFCEKCFQVLKDKDSSEAKKIIEKLIKVGMSSDTLFTRVLFNFGSYREF